MCFGGSSGPKPEPVLPKPAPVPEAVPVPNENLGQTPQTKDTETAAVRKTAQSTGLNIPTV